MNSKLTDNHNMAGAIS